MPSTVAPIHEMIMNVQNENKTTDTTTNSGHMTAKEDLQKPPSQDAVSKATETSVIVSLPSNPQLLYGITERPPVHVTVSLGFQFILTTVTGLLAAPTLIAPVLCVTEDVDKVNILTTVMFTSGLSTIAQTMLGARLPVYQGASTFTTLAPTLAIMALPKFQCVDESNKGNTSVNVSDTYTNQILSQENDDGWKMRMREIQGAIICASLLEIVLGAFGLMGVLARYLGPLVVAPTISLMGLSLFAPAAAHCAGNWYVALMTICLFAAFALYLRNTHVPCFTCNKSAAFRCKPARTSPCPLFQLFPMIFAIALAWFICAILTWTGAFPDDPDHFAYAARTDIKLDAVYESKWFRIPFPFQWGMPTFGVSSILGMLSPILVNAVVALGNFQYIADVCQVPKPPDHATNRGILVEGLASLLSGLWGTGSASCCFAETAAVLSITQVVSRLVLVSSGILLMIFGVFGKIAAVFILIPDPIVGGLFMVVFGIVAASGIATLRQVDMTSFRNICIFGVSVIFGLSFPFWLGQNPGAISTGNLTFDQVTTVLLSTPMFIGGATACILDNTVPGSLEERGLSRFILVQDRKSSADSDICVSELKHDDVYDLPACISTKGQSARLFARLPFCSTYKEIAFCRRIPLTDPDGSTSEEE